MTGRQAANSGEQRLLADHVAEAQVGVEHVEVEVARQRAVGEQGFDLAGEAQHAVALAQVERLHADVIDRQHEPLCVGVPQSEGVHPAQMGEQVKPVLLVEVDDRLAVALRAEVVFLLHQRAAQFFVVVDFAVEDQRNRAIFVIERLVAPGDVDDAQAAHPHRQIGLGAGRVKAVAVRSAMLDRGAHRAHSR